MAANAGGSKQRAQHVVRRRRMRAKERGKNEPRILDYRDSRFPGFHLLADARMGLAHRGHRRLPGNRSGRGGRGLRRTAAECAAKPWAEWSAGRPLKFPETP